MRVLAVFDEDVAELAARVAGKDVVGVIVGHVGAGRSYPLVFVDTPPAAGAGLTQAWVLEHAKQVFRGLPGGLCVLGFYYTAPTAPSCLPSVSAFASLADRCAPFSADATMLVLNVCTSPRRLSCKEHALVDGKPTTSPVEVKSTHTRIALTPVWSSLVISLPPVPVPHHSVSAVLKDRLELFEHTLREGGVVVDGNLLRDPSASVDSVLNNNASHTAQLFLPVDTPSPEMVSQSNADSDVEEESDEEQEWPVTHSPTVPALAHIQGQVTVLTYVHPTDTVGSLEQGLKDDVCRSLRSRLEVLHADLLLQFEEDDASPAQPNTDAKRGFDALYMNAQGYGWHAFPARVLWQLNQTYGLLASEYVVEDEEDEEMFERCSSVFGTSSVTVSQREVLPERVEAPSKPKPQPKPKSASGTPAATGHGPTPPTSVAPATQRAVPAWLIAAVATAVAAFVVGASGLLKG